MKNRIDNLNDHLFAQIERLSVEGMTPDQIKTEAQRGDAIVAAADTIIRGAAVQLQAAKLYAEHGHKAPLSGYMPEALEKKTTAPKLVASSK